MARKCGKCLGPVLECGKLGLEIARVPDIVGIEESQKILGGELHQAIAGTGNSLILLHNKCDLIPERSEHILSIVGAAIQEDDNLSRCDRLIQYGGQALCDCIRGIIGWDQNTNSHNEINA